jgi:hypothetical protein
VSTPSTNKWEGPRTALASTLPPSKERTFNGLYEANHQLGLATAVSTERNLMASKHKKMKPMANINADVLDDDSDITSGEDSFIMKPSQ